MSQPAVSHALTRLRLSLKDPLFVRAPGGVRPTARAEHFARFVEAALRSLDVALQESDRFEPESSQRRFALHMSDLATGDLLPALLPALRREAPGIRLEVTQLDGGQLTTALDEGRLDLAFGYLPQLEVAHRQALFDEHYVVLMRAGHPLRQAVHDRRSLEQLEFILVDSHQEPARALHRLGLESRIRLTIPHFTVVPALLAHSDLAVIIPSRPAAQYVRAAPPGSLVVVEADLGLPPMTISIHWSWRLHSDPGHRWLRERVLQTLAQPGAANAAQVT